MNNDEVVLNYNSIKEQYDVEVLQLIRRVENTSKSRGRHQSHLRFYLQCKRKEITPKGLKIKAQQKDPRSRRIIEKAQKALLNVRISEVVSRNNSLEKKKQTAIEDLQKKIPENLHKKILEINEKRQKTALEKSSETQKKKYQRNIKIC